MAPRFEWDEGKAVANERKHGIRFSIVFLLDWSQLVIVDDDRFDYGEPRYLAYGRLEGAGYAIVFTPRAGALRIISIRPAGRKELADYGL